MMRHSAIWDSFIALWRELVPFEADDDTYRMQRATSFFCAATTLCNGLTELDPGMQTWCPHILCNVVPRQIVEFGDPIRRGCDANEAFGASLKFILHNLVCRRSLPSEPANTAK